MNNSQNTLYFCEKIHRNKAYFVKKVKVMKIVKLKKVILTTACLIISVVVFVFFYTKNKSEYRVSDDDIISDFNNNFSVFEKIKNNINIPESNDIVIRITPKNVPNKPNLKTEYDILFKKLNYSSVISLYDYNGDYLVKFEFNSAQNERRYICYSEEGLNHSYGIYDIDLGNNWFYYADLFT
jgi:hypothetical protein